MSDSATQLWIDLWLVPAGTTVRDVLCTYLDCAPSAVRILRGANGRPYLDSSRHPSPPSFNSSNARDCSLVAVSSAEAVGVDLERSDEPPIKLPHVVRYLAPEEQAALEQIDPSTRNAALLRLWTCKEAFIKATGLGMSQPLDSFACSVEPSPRLLRVPDGGPWTLRTLELAPPFVGSVVWRGADIRLRLADW